LSQLVLEVADAPAGNGGVDPGLDRCELALQALVDLCDLVLQATSLGAGIAAELAGQGLGWERKAARRWGPKMRVSKKRSTALRSWSSRTYFHLRWPSASAAVSP
jgi:hypothetical protein